MLRPLEDVLRVGVSGNEVAISSEDVTRCASGTAVLLYIPGLSAADRDWLHARVLGGTQGVLQLAPVYRSDSLLPQS